MADNAAVMVGSGKGFAGVDIYNHLTQRNAYDGSNQLVYQGWAKPGSATSGAVWVIARYTWSGGLNTVREWADGNHNFDNVWDDRAALSYS